MNKSFSKKGVFLVLALAVIGLGFYFSKNPVSAISPAPPGEVTYGWAWAENFGWISFNSIDGGGSAYTVGVDSEDKFSGHAWSENLGWLSFNRGETGNPPSNDPGNGSGAIAELTGDNRVIGWARFLSQGGGWDGWVRFDPLFNSTVTVDPVSGDFHGWAWGSEVTGWISFNSADSGASGSYKVSLRMERPIVSNMRVAWTDYCSYSPTGSVNLEWRYNGFEDAPESQYQLLVDDNADFSSPEVDLTMPSTTASGDLNSRTLNIKQEPSENELEYNKTYYWRVKEWDNFGLGSDFFNAPSPFSTPIHPYPSISFTWSQDVRVGTSAHFEDATTVFGGALKSAWSWTFENGTPATSTAATADVVFDEIGGQDVNLRVTDTHGFVCNKTLVVPVKKANPVEWGEI